jgi:branched-chain amino acid transport system ATP-binding protein
MLRVNNLTKYFGGLVVVNDLDLHIAQSEILGLIGPNGAGKTTLFKLITGFLKPTRGEVIFENKDITGFSPHEIAQLGIDQSFQASTLFTRLSVLDNVFIGYHMRYQTSIWKRLLRTSSALKEEREFRQNAMEILEFMGLEALKDELAENLSHGHQKILSVCMALATNPKLLLLDEPVAGMSQSESQTMIKLIRKIRDRGLTILVVEHDMKVIMSLCERIVVLTYGQKLMEGSPKEVMESEDVIEAYLGKAEI